MKSGVFTGHYAINPFSSERLPIWVANYILADYGTGAIMSVPAHDERDYDFARKYDIEMRVVILPRRTDESNGDKEPDSMLPYTEEDSLLINSGEFNSLGNQEAQQKMAVFAEEKGFGKPTITFRLKDWGVSRQRYWGTPIPMLYCGRTASFRSRRPAAGAVADNVEITQEGGSPLGRFGVSEHDVSEWRPCARNRTMGTSSTRPGASTATSAKYDKVHSIHRNPILVPHRSIHRRLSTPFCTSSIRASGRR